MRTLKTWTIKEVKDTREMMIVPGIIGSPLVLTPDAEIQKTQQPIYKNFSEYVLAMEQKH